jgi:hypothetical protein
MNTRNEIEVMLAKIHYSYSIIRDKERKRRDSINKITAITALFFLVGMFCVRMQYGANVPVADAWTHRKFPIYFPTVAFVVWSGFIGGFMSLLVRLVNIPTKGDDATLLAELETVTRTLYSGPIIGGIFALLLYFTFSAKLVTGDLFPQMMTYTQAMDQKTKQPIANPPEADKRDLGDVELTTLYRELKLFMPVDGRSLALLLVWCFIAGYAQTFVPDKLKAITTRGTSGGDGRQ